MKILIALPRFPYPLEKGDKLRAYNQIKELAKENTIYLFCVSHHKLQPEHVEALRPYCQEICVVRPCKVVSYLNVIRNYMLTKSLQIGYWDSKKARRSYRKFEHKVRPDVIYSQMVRTMPWVSRSPLPKVMDFQDALSMNTERRMEKAHWPLRQFLHYEFKMLRSSEYNAFHIFDALTIISEPDSDAIPHRKNGEIHIIPNGVDFNFFAPINCEKHYDIVFCGNMQYEPNVNACKFLVNEVMPLVWQQFPQAKVLLSGATPKGSIVKLGEHPLVEVSGWVDDIRQSYAQSKILAAPMQIGSGLQNKLLEAMAMGIPCVTTSLANASLGADADKDVLIGDTAEAYSRQLCKLLADDNLRKTVANNGHRFVKEHYSWESAGKKLASVLLEASRHKATGRGLDALY